MQGKTHRVGGVLSSLVGFTLLSANDLLVPDVNPLVQLAVIYPFAIYGSTVSDLDHNWQSAPSKDPFSWCINKILHLGTEAEKHGMNNLVVKAFNAKHRSWQTHSDVFLVLFLAITWYLMTSAVPTVESILLRLIFLGLSLGVVSHMILDALTPEGIWFLIPSIIRHREVKFHLVPKSEFFATGGQWEKLVGILMKLVSTILFIYVVYKASPYKISFNFI